VRRRGGRSGIGTPVGGPAAARTGVLDRHRRLDARAAACGAREPRRAPRRSAVPPGRPPSRRDRRPRAGGTSGSARARCERAARASMLPVNRTRVRRIGASSDGTMRTCVRTGQVGAQGEANGLARGNSLGVPCKETCTGGVVMPGAARGAAAIHARKRPAGSGGRSSRTRTRAAGSRTA
jgi:hypothetical protein